MTLSDIATQARFIVNGDSTNYPDANLLIHINIWMQKIVSMILESEDESDFDDANITATYPIYQVTLAARRDYAFSSANWVALGKEGAANASAAAVLPLKVKKLEIAYDGTNYYKAQPFDTGEVDYGSETASLVDANFTTVNPVYDIKYNAIFIYPTPTADQVTAGAKMRVEFERNVIPFTSSDLSTGTAVPGFDAPFHPMVAEGAALEYARSRQMPQVQELVPSLVDWENRLRTYYGRKQLDRELTLVNRYDDSYGR